jgi:hypothetical protein
VANQLSLVRRNRRTRASLNLANEILAMSTTELIDQLKKMSDQERLEVIETATRLVRSNLQTSRSKSDQDRHMREAAARIRDLYDPGGELSEWTILDGEEPAVDYI